MSAGVGGRSCCVEQCSAFYPLCYKNASLNMWVEQKRFGRTCGDCRYQCSADVIIITTGVSRERSTSLHSQLQLSGVSSAHSPRCSPLISRMEQWAASSLLAVAVP